MKKQMKRFLSLLLSMSMVSCGVPAIPLWAATADPQESVHEFFVEQEELISALGNALIQGEPVREAEYKFTGAQKDDYEKLFYWDDVYEIFPEIKDDRNGNMKLKVFARFTGDHDLDGVSADGSGELIFLFLNRNGYEEQARIGIGPYLSDIFTVVPKNGNAFDDPGIEETAETVIVINAEDLEEEISAEGASGGSGGAVSVLDPEVEIQPSDEDYREEVVADPEEDRDPEEEGTDHGEEGREYEEEGTDPESEGSDPESERAEGGNESTDTGSENTDTGSESTDTGNEGTDTGSESSDNGSGSYSGSHDPGSSDPGDRESASQTQMASVTARPVSLLGRPPYDASPSDAEDTESGLFASSGAIQLDGELYGAVIVNGQSSAVAFVTTLNGIGVEEVSVSFYDEVYTASSGGIDVRVSAPAGALPEGAELFVERYDMESEEFGNAAKALGIIGSCENMAVLDISFMADGEEVEPEDEVEVVIDASAILPYGADAGSIEVSHLEENGNSRLQPVVVANSKKGNISKTRGVARFSVESFSNFTITWESGSNSTEVTVYVYDINGLGIYDADEQHSYSWENGTLTIADLIEEHTDGKIGDGYTYSYATAQYLTTSNMGGNVTTIGSSSDPVVSVEWNGTAYTVTMDSGAEENITKSDSVAVEFYINLYFSTPVVTISVSGTDYSNHTVSLSAVAEYFQDTAIEYEWEITEGGEYATISGSGAYAAVVWNPADQAGNTVTVRVTAKSESGEEAIDTFELTYGMEQVTFTLYYGTTGTSGTAADGAHIAIYDEEGKLIANGTSGSNGEVTIWIIPGTKYTLEVSYTYGSGQSSYVHYSYEDTGYVYAGDGSDVTDIYMVRSDAVFYEHVDVKLSIADEDAGYSDILSNVDYVKIYDEEGVLLYQSSEMVHNSGTNDYNVLFADADGNEGTNPHSIAFYDSYTIEIAYEVSYTYTDLNGNSREYTESYVAKIDKDSVYADGEYYSYNGTNAYQLYNEMYDTDYTESSFAAAVAAGEGSGGLTYYNEHGIDISGESYFFVAAALCDTKDSANQAGLDLALGVNSLRRYSSTTWNFDISKTLKNSGAEAGAFTFSLYSASVDDDEWSIDVSGSAQTGSLEFSISNGTMILPDGAGESEAYMSGFFSFNFDSSMVGQTQTYCFVLLEEKGEDENITYSEAVYGIMIEVTLNDAGDMSDVTIEEKACELAETTGSDTDQRTFIRTGDFDGESDESGYTIFPFTNSYTVIIDTTEIVLEKEVSGDAGDTTEYEFEITIVGGEEDDPAVTGFGENGTLTVTVTAGEKSVIEVPSGYEYRVTEKTTGADTVTVYKDGEITASVKGSTSEAVAELGTIAESTQVKFVNSYRAYFPIDEEIVTDTDDIWDREAWVKDEAVNEYNAIEIEMTTRLPVITAYDLINGSFTMNFHEVLDHELILDEDTADFSVYIAEVPVSVSYYRITFDDETEDECNFHVDVDLTALYEDGIVTVDMLEGNTEITIFFFADLEGTGLNGSYKSTIWYEVYDAEEKLYTSNTSVVEVYTYEIDIAKTDRSTGSALKGAEFGIFYDSDCTGPVSRDGLAYTAISDSSGSAVFYGLKNGTYYVKELQAPAGYHLNTEVFKVELGSEMESYRYDLSVQNRPVSSGGGGGGGGGSSSGSFRGGNSTGGPGSGTSSGDGVVWELLDLPQTGDSPALLFAALSLVFSAMALIVLALIKRKKGKEAGSHEEQHP